MVTVTVRGPHPIYINQPGWPMERLEVLFSWLSGLTNKWLGWYVGWDQPSFDIPDWCISHDGSTKLVYLPTWMVDFYGKCMWICLGSTPHPETVTNRKITCLVGNPYRPMSLYLPLASWVGGRSKIYHTWILWVWCVAYITWPYLAGGLSIFHLAQAIDAANLTINFLPRPTCRVVSPKCGLVRESHLVLGLEMTGWGGYLLLLNTSVKKGVDDDDDCVNPLL